MARLVKHEAQGPKEVKVGNETTWMCMCGLSKNEPFCDGSHKKTKDEQDGRLYVYNKKGDRVEVESQ